jgi:cell division protease FtsH
MNQDSDYPESTADRIDDEVCKIVNYCEEKALQIILDNRVIIDLVVERLLDVETMEGDEFRDLLSTYTILPNKKAAYISKIA